MSLKGLQLSQETLATLYTQPLHPQEGALLKEEKVAPEILIKTDAGIKPAQKYLGGNARSITVLVRYHDAPYLNDTLFEFFTGILNACKLSMKDIALINLVPTPGDYKTIISETQPSRFLMLGIEPADIGLPMQFPQFQVYTHDKISYLSSPALDVLLDDEALKRELWKALKALFEL